MCLFRGCGPTYLELLVLEPQPLVARWHNGLFTGYFSIICAVDRRCGRVLWGGAAIGDREPPTGADWPPGCSLSSDWLTASAALSDWLSAGQPGGTGRRSLCDWMFPVADVVAGCWV